MKAEIVRFLNVKTKRFVIKSYALEKYVKLLLHGCALKSRIYLVTFYEISCWKKSFLRARDLD